MCNSTDLLNFIPVDPLTGSIATPVYQTSTFVQSAPGVHKGFDYARSNNPTRQVLEKLIAKIENGHAGFAFSTGLAAIDAVVKLLSSGDEIIAVDDIYGGAYRLFAHIYEKFGITVHYVDTTNANNIEPYLSEKTKLIWIESPTNPTLKVSDIQKISTLAKSVGALTVVDNTFAGPITQKPLNLGADVVIHSGTKYIGGHSDLVAGLVVTKSQSLSEKLKFIQNSTGAVLGPWDAFLTIRGIETLPLRFKTQSDNALQIAKWLEGHKLIDQLYYPGLESHKNHDIARAQQKGLYGGVISFSLKSDTIDDAVNFVTSTQQFHLAESLGGVKSLICHPAQMTHASVPEEKRRQAGIQDSLIRLSVGIEQPQDLISDLEEAFQSINSLKAVHA